MSRKIMTVAPVLATGAAAVVLALAPQASAEPEQCNMQNQATVCQQPGNSDITVAPPQTSGTGGTGGGANTQNGNYGPSGDVPPVGN